MSDNKIRHLEMIQKTIDRMANNSFLIRGWTVTIISAMFALSAKDVNSQYILIAYFSIPIFWTLDSFYLHQEKCYRALYDTIRKKSGETDFSMDAKEFDVGRNTWLHAAISKTTVIFYGGVILLVLFVMFGFKHG